MKKIIIIAVIVVVAAAAIYWLVIKQLSTTPPFDQKAEESAAPTESFESSGVGGQFFEQVQQNPAQKMPETNPFQAEINPYKGAYNNPFE